MAAQPVPIVPDTKPDDADFAMVSRSKNSTSWWPLLTALCVALACGGTARAAEPVATPDTVVLLHGLGRSTSAMWVMKTRLKAAGFEVVNIGYRSLSRTPEQILVDVNAEIASCCAKPQGAAKLHFVGHSLGGLLIRGHLARQRYAHLGRVVLIGTPSGGTGLVDKWRDKWWFEFAGPTARSLGTDGNSFPNSLPKPDYPVGVIAGVKPNDRNEELLPGDDDGLVPVESTRVDGMADFIVVEGGHAALRYSPEVARQVTAFLRHGSFTARSN